MRSLLPILACALAATPATASSIQPVTGGNKGQGSVATVSCAQCPPLKEKEKSNSYVVPEIEPGTQKVEIREVGGERKIFRSEAWLGGSPVLFVTKAPEGPVDTAEMPKEDAETVDTAATTGAVEGEAARLAVTASASAPPPSSRELDASAFELRLN